MRNQILLILFFLLLFTGIAQAKDLDLCKSTYRINSNCTMLTPVVSCTSYTYNIYNVSGLEVENGSLGNFSGSIYYLNITLPEGGYIVKLCDGSTREIVLEDEGDNMIVAIIILIPILLGLFMLFGSFSLSEVHNPLKIFLFLLSFVPFFASMHFGMLAIVKFYDWPELQNLIGSTTYWVGAMFGIIIIYFVIYLFWLGTNVTAQKKKERLEY